MTGGGVSVMNSCTGSLSTADACLVIPCHIRFMGCGLDAECIENDAAVGDGIWKGCTQSVIQHRSFRYCGGGMQCLK